MLDGLLGVFESEAARVIAMIAGGAILLGVVGLVLALASYAKTINWAPAPGRIIRSEPGFELVQRFNNEPPRNERVAKIVYEFEANRQKFRSGRILDAGKPDQDQVERLLADYPVGREVTIRHDPRDPSKSALEINHPPKDLAWGCLTAIGLVVVCAAAAIWVAESGFEKLQGAFPDAILPALLATGFLALAFAAMFVIGRRHATAIARWPTATGTVTLSRVEEFTVRRDRPRQTLRGRRFTRKGYMPVVEYRYEVGGKAFSSRSIWADTEVSGDEAYATKIASRYVPGAIVMVLYDPANPKRSALEPPGGMYWLFLVGAAVCFAASVAASRMFF